jgi:hypothetical protein
MHSFELASFEPGRHLTARTRAGRSRAFFGDVAASYLLLDEPSGCRIVFKAAIRLPGGRARQSLMRTVLPSTDLVLMRRQLRTIRDLAESSPAV